MLDDEVLRRLARHDEPFRYAVADGVFREPAAARACAATFPDALLRHRLAAGPDVEKTYDMFSLTLVEPGAPRPTSRKVERRRSFQGACSVSVPSGRR